MKRRSFLSIAAKTVAAGTVFCDSDGVVDALLLNRFGEPWMMGRLLGRGLTETRA